MPQQIPLRPGDPSRVGPYRLGGRIEGIPSEDPIFIGLAPDGTEVAISMLGGDWARDPAARDRFAAEAAVAMRVPPFCAARVLDAGLDASGAYLVSEYVGGPSLLELILADGVWRGQELEAIAIGMATGLASVHQAGLVHGNFGPEYVVIASHGAPRVVEFGITPPYGSATPAADLLAWARTVVFAASGRPPATLGDLDILPGRLRAPVEDCLSTEPADRPAAGAVVLTLLGEQQSAAGVLAEGARLAARAAVPGGHHQPLAGPAYPGAVRALAPARPPHQHHKARGHADRTGGELAGPRAADPRSGHSRYDAPPAGRTGGHRAAGQQHAHAPQQHAHARPGRRPAWLVAAAVVIILITAGVVHLILADGSHAASGQLSANSRQATTSPSATPSLSRGPGVPAAFAGTWTGLVRQPPTDTYNVTVAFAAGAVSGTVSYSGTGLSCSGALNVTAATAARMILSQGIITGQSKCGNGRVTITLAGPRSLRFSFHGSGPVAAGTLSRT